MMEDSAVSPVVAVMLILAIVVTFVSISHTIIVPSMKAQSEIEHFGKVEESFLRFGSDIELAASLKRDIRLSERIPLGGGDFLLNPVRSSGTLRVLQEPNWIVNVTVRNATDSVTRSAMLVNVSYSSSENFWQDQGYRWQYGYTNISKGRVETPLELPTMTDVIEQAGSSGFGTTLLDLEYSPATVPVIDANATVTGFDTNCTSIAIGIVNVTAGERNFASGNGFCTLALDCTRSAIDTVENPEQVTIRVNRNLPVPLDVPLWEKCNATAWALDTACTNIGNYAFATTPEFDEFSIGISRSGTPVTVQVVETVITVMAY
ncbi:hypothetical protein ABH15_09050 [Methanoculleus taiwanensis]|uniref:Archaeal Type IV pilin N-terminal domain-containing protein n=1 Tax=Methanoculleus taiwanensis TaxID=1550565 RepID=A0A498H0Z1_9EURY|nr:hypothetical protein [Methanoculleus taiwanensis]RXE56268.1 hypothetical protein ABH15_09050 [Methanoculleus taiwanensis]